MIGPVSQLAKALFGKEPISLSPSRLSECLETLDARQAVILRLRFGFYPCGQRTLREIGRFFGISVERVRQLEGRALRCLRHGPRGLYLRGKIPALEVHLRSGHYMSRQIRQTLIPSTALRHLWDEHGRCHLPDVDIENLGFSTRAFCTLKLAGITSLRQLSKERVETLRTIRGCGKKTFKEIVDYMLLSVPASSSGTEGGIPRDPTVSVGTDIP